MEMVQSDLKMNGLANYTHNLLPEGAEKPAVWGYELISKAFV